MCAQASQNFNKDNSIKNVILDFQGGGAFFANLIGAIIPIIQDPDIRVVGVQGTSAGAMISCITADAFNSCDTYDEGRKLAIQKLNDFSDRVVIESAQTMHALNLATNAMNARHWVDFTNAQIATHTRDDIYLPFNLMRHANVLNPFSQFITPHIDAFEKLAGKAHRQSLIGSLAIPRESPNLPILLSIENNKQHLKDIFNVAANDTLSIVAATKILRKIVVDSLHSTQHPTDKDDRVLTHVASNKFMTAHINTARVNADGTLTNIIHTGQNITQKSLLGSAAVKNLLSPSIINGETHIDGGYTENGCLSVPQASLPRHDGIIIIGTNRPREENIIPQRQSDFHPQELKQTRNFVLHQMYREVVLRAQEWKPGEPTIHLITYNHPPEYDWTSRQNTSHWHIEMLKAHGAQDGKNALQEFKHKIGIENTVSKEKLEAIARGEDTRPDIHPYITAQKQPPIALQI